MRTSQAAAQETVIPFSLIRTLTVGAGFTPALLTPPLADTPVDGRSRAHARVHIPPVGNFTPPRERVPFHR